MKHKNETNLEGSTEKCEELSKCWFVKKVLMWVACSVAVDVVTDSLEKDLETSLIRKYQTGTANHCVANKLTESGRLCFKHLRSFVDQFLSGTCHDRPIHRSYIAEIFSSIYLMMQHCTHLSAQGGFYIQTSFSRALNIMT